MPVNVTSPRLVARLADPSLASALSRFVRARVPESEVEDIVQATLSDALQAEQHPEQDEDIVRGCRHLPPQGGRLVPALRREVPRDLEGETRCAAESAPRARST